MTASSPLACGAPVLRRLALVLGWISLLATLALLSPGVVATANADESASIRAQTARTGAPLGAERDER